MASIDHDIYKILGEQSKALNSSDEWKTILTTLEQRYRETFDGVSFNDEVYRLIALVKFRVGLCLVDEGQLVEAVEYYKQAWIQIGAFHPSDETQREFIRALGQAAGHAATRLIPMRGKRVMDDVIVGQVALGIAFAAFVLTDPKDDGAW